MNSKRKRGRPLGSDKPGDDILLAKLADLLLAEPHLKCATAIKRVVAKYDDTIIRRLRDKFNRRKGQLMADAQERRIRRQPRDVDARAYGRFALQQARQWPDSQLWAALKVSAVIGNSAADSPAATRLKAMCDHQAVQMLRNQYAALSPLKAALEYLSKPEVQAGIELAKRMQAVGLPTG